MRKYFITKGLKIINQYYYKKFNVSEISYGLEILFIFISKSLFIFTIAYFLGIFKNLMILMLFYSLCKIPAHGCHTNSSLLCFIASTVIFIGATYLGAILPHSYYLICYLNALFIVLYFIFSPADTNKKPIINSKKRIVLKYISVFIAIIYALISITINNIIVSNYLTIASGLEALIISPLMYSLFNEKYNKYNHIKYCFKGGDNKWQ